MARPLSRRVLARHLASELVAGKKIADVAQQLAAYLIVHKKTNDAPTLLRDIAHHLAEAGHVEAVVTVAHELNSATEAAIVTLVKDVTDAKDVHLAVEVDPRVLGGVKITTPGSELDATVTHQLQTLKTRYRKA